MAPSFALYPDHSLSLEIEALQDSSFNTTLLRAPTPPSSPLVTSSSPLPLLGRGSHKRKFNSNRLIEQFRIVRPFDRRTRFFLRWELDEHIALCVYISLVCPATTPHPPP